MKSTMVRIFLCTMIIANVFTAIIFNLGLISMNASGEGGLADSPWPMFRQNLNHTGVSPYDTSANNGELKWSFKTGDMIFSSPAIGSDGTIYIGSWDKNLYAINPDGTEKWNFTTGDWIEWSSPAIGSDGTIYVGSWDKKLHAINPDGTEKWNFTTGHLVNSSPTIWADGTIYVGSNDLYAINPDGTEKWSFTTGSGVISSPAIGIDGTIYVGSTTPDYKLYSINPDGTEKWNFTTGNQVDSSPAIGFDGTIYVGSSDYNIYAINPDGTEKWNFTTGSGVTSSPAIDSDGTIYIGSSDNKLYAINPDGSEKWNFTTGNYIYFSSPAIGFDGTIYIGSGDDKLYAINPDGSEKWNFTTGSDVVSSPAIGSDGTIYVGSADGKLYAFRTPNQPPIADAGPDQTVNEGDVVLLDGNGSIGGTSPGITPPSNLVSWWPGDGNASDIIDGNHGTLLDGTTFDAGKVKQAFSFDGIDDRLSVADSDNLKITGSLTIDAWIYIESFPSPLEGAGQILFRGDDRNSLDPYYLTTLSNGKIRFHIESLTNAVNLEILIPEDQFVLVTATLDNASGLMRIYINDTVAAETTTDVRPFRDLDPLYNPGVGIGNHAPSAIFNQPFHGIIDELEIFNRALKASEIQALFYADSAGKCKGFGGKAQIISYEWDFESDGIYDYRETSKIAPDGAFDGKTTHVYGDNGVYIVTLRVTDETGANDTDTCIVTVNNIAPKIEPFGPFTVEEGFPVSIDATATDPGSDDLTFTWNWGDGTSDTINVHYNDGIGPDPYPSPFGTFPFYANETVQHTYGNTGVYTINLTVEDDDDGITIFSTNITVIGSQPPTLYINISQDREDVILYWDPPSTPGIDHYLIYRSTSQTGFDFNTVWVNTSKDNESGEPGPIPLRTMWNDTNAAFPDNDTNYEEQIYYIIRAVNVLGEVSRTSRTVGKWTKIFPQGVSTFSLPLEPLETMNTTTDYYLKDMNARYIKWMDPVNHIWMKHGDGSDNDTQLEVGKGYKVKFSNQTNYTFSGMPGAMINYDDDSGFIGFDPYTETKNLTAIVDILTGNVTLNWTKPSTKGVNNQYHVLRSTTRDGFWSGNYIQLATLSFDVCNYTDIGNATAGTQFYYMIVPMNETGVKGASTYSISVWTANFSEQYDTIGLPLKIGNCETADWYCNNIPNAVGINYYNVSAQRWCWHSTRMLGGAFDPILVMTEGYQISTSGETKFTFIGV